MRGLFLHHNFNSESNKFKYTFGQSRNQRKSVSLRSFYEIQAGVISCFFSFSKLFLCG